MLHSHLVFAILLVVVFLSLHAVARAEAIQLKIGDGSDWHFVAGAWQDNGDQMTGPVRTGGAGPEDGDGLQGFNFAFNKKLAYSDLESELTISMAAGHADIGLIVRAQDPTHYYLVHFPQCGQGYRAQHFWAAISKADGSGYLRLLKVQHVQRVASNPFGIVHKAKVKVEGNRIQVWLNGHPAIDVTDDTYAEGYIGVAGFAKYQHGPVTVDGKSAQPPPFNDQVPQVKNWFNPFPDQRGQLGNVSMVKTAAGTVLCSFISNAVTYLGRSSDLGKTWSVQPAPANFNGGLMLLKDGRLVSMSLSDKGGGWSESTDDGKTWINPVTTSVEKPASLKKLETGWPLQLSDGTIVRFGLGHHVSLPGDAKITQWGVFHCQAFSTRSTDGGKTWSKPANLDSDSPDMGNLDLTEPVAFETTDGRIMCLIRPIYSPWMWETWSSDKAQSWGPCVRGPFAGWAPSPPVRTQNGTVVFPTRFPGLTLHSTRDDGHTWDVGTYIDTSIWAMGALCEVEPNVVLFIYMDSWNDTLRGQFFRVTDKSLEPISPPQI